MKEYLIYGRNSIIHFFYKYFLKPFFFKLDPERVHDGMIKFSKRIGRFPLCRKIIQICFDYNNPSLRQNILGLSFKNPVGLSAGFDKNAELTDILPSVGFGFVEVGSITGDYCDGNPRPRLWRLKKDKSLAVYYGLKNDGCEIISKRLQDNNFIIPVGVSVAMTNCQKNLDIDRAILDYEKAFRTMEPIANYLTINISCPNTLGGQPFVEPKNINKLLSILDKVPTKKPIFVKFSPDLNISEIDALLEVLSSHRVDGIICANLTKKKADNLKIFDEKPRIKGGLSGKVVQDASDELLSYIYKKAGERFILIGCGGIFNADDAYKKIRLGASLVQMMTGLIFEGPQVVGQINQDIAKFLKRDGFKSIEEAIGVDNR